MKEKAKGGRWRRGDEQTGPANRESPKSAITRCSQRLASKQRMFSGLRSRCTMPLQVVRGVCNHSTQWKWWWQWHTMCLLPSMQIKERRADLFGLACGVFCLFCMLCVLCVLCVICVLCVVRCRCVGCGVLFVVCCVLMCFDCALCLVLVLVLQRALRCLL